MLQIIKETIYRKSIILRDNNISLNKILIGGGNRILYITFIR